MFSVLLRMSLFQMNRTFVHAIFSSFHLKSKVKRSQHKLTGWICTIIYSSNKQTNKQNNKAK